MRYRNVRRTDEAQTLIRAETNAAQKESAKLYKIVATSSEPERVADEKDRLKVIKSELKTFRLVMRDCDAIVERTPCLDSYKKTFMPKQRAGRAR